MGHHKGKLGLLLHLNVTNVTNNGAKMITKGTQRSLMVPKWCPMVPNGAQMVPKRYPNEPKRWQNN